MVRSWNPVNVHQPLAIVRLVVIAGRSGQRQERIAVVGRGESNDLVLGRAAALDPVLPSELEGGLDRLGTAAQEVELVERRRDESGEFVGQVLDHLAGEGGPVDVGDLGGLVGHRLADFGHTVADADYESAAGTIEVPAAVSGMEPATLPMGYQRKIPRQLAVEDVRIGVVSLVHPDGNLT